MDGDFEYNELTKKLLSEGYTVGNYPDYVQIDTSRLTGDDPLRNSSCGFVYKRQYSGQFVYMTGCGKFVRGENVMEMWTMGIDWRHENDNPVIRCPYDRPECPDNDPKLHGMHEGGLSIQCFCVCHRTGSGYDYENSIEKANEERREEKERKYQEYSDAHNGRVCRNHMYYDERVREWSLRYEPKRCAGMCYSKDGYCPILGKQLSRKKGNVYYDMKKSYIRRDGTLFDGEKIVHVEKGIRYFRNPASMDICEAFIKVQSDEIIRDYEINHSRERFWNKTMEVEVLNIRAESRPSRDLMQDLQDIKAGITVTHASDLEKKQNEIKKQQRRERQEQRIKRLEKKILETGYYGLKESSADRIHADKWLGGGRIAELEEMRQQVAREKQNEPVQMSLFDYL